MDIADFRCMNSTKTKQREILKNFKTINNVAINVLNKCIPSLSAKKYKQKFKEELNLNAKIFLKVQSTETIK